MKRTTIVIIVMLVAGLFIVPWGWFDIVERSYEKPKPDFGEGEYVQKTLTFADVKGVNVTWLEEDADTVKANYNYSYGITSPLICVKCEPSDTECAELSYSSKWDEFMSISESEKGNGELQLTIQYDLLLSKYKVVNADTLVLKLPKNETRNLSLSLVGGSLVMRGIEGNELNMLSAFEADFEDCKFNTVKSSVGRGISMCNVTIAELFRTANSNSAVVLSGDSHIGKEYILPNSDGYSRVMIGDECDEVILLSDNVKDIEVTLSRPAKIIFDK